MTPAQAQQTPTEKVVWANDPVQITDAVMITDISVGNKSVQCGLFVKPPAVIQPVVPFQTSSDWLQRMAISLINRTDKTIVYVAIDLPFLDTGDCRSQPCAAYEIHSGQLPAVDAYSGRTGQPLTPERLDQPPLDWRPGQTIVVSVGDYINEINSAVSNFLSVAALTKVAVHIGPAFFKEGLRWTSAGYATPDSEHRGKFKYLPYDYFPGRRGQNWPPGYNR